MAGPNISGTDLPCQSETISTEPSIVYWISTSMHLISLLPCLIGNILVLVVLLKHKKLRTKTNMFILSLALADILVGVTVVPIKIANLFSTDRSIWFCTLHKFFVTFPLGCSLFALLLISIDRYLAVAHPFLYVAKMTKKVIRRSIAMTWVFMLGVCAPILLAPKFLNTPEQPVEDTPDQTCNPAGIKPPEYAIFIYTVLLSIYIINAALYMWVAKVAIKQRKRINDEIAQHASITRAAAEVRRSTKITIIMFGLFMVLWAPYMVVLLLHLLKRCLKSDQVCRQACQLTLSIGIINSGFNCYFYAWQKQDIRWAIKALLRLRGWRHRISSLTTTDGQRYNVSAYRNSAFMLFPKTPSHRTELTMVASTAKPSAIDINEYLTDMKRVQSSVERLTELESSEAFAYFRRGSASVKDEGTSRNPSSTIQTIREKTSAEQSENNEYDEPITMVAVPRGDE